MSVLLLSTVLSLAGCSHVQSDNPDHRPATASEQSVLDAAKRHSSEILDASGLKGSKVSPGGPLVQSEPEGVADTFSVAHSWAVYPRDDAAIGQGFDRLHADMPGMGWKVTFDGRAHDAAHTRTFDIENGHDHFTAHIQWVRKSQYGPAMLSVDLDSPVYYKPSH